MRDAAPRTGEIPQLQLAQFLAAQRMIEQRRQDGAIAFVLNALIAGRSKQLAGLMITKRRRLAFAALSPRPLDAFNRIVGDGVLLTEIFE